MSADNMISIKKVICYLVSFAALFLPYQSPSAIEIRSELFLRSASVTSVRPRYVLTQHN